MTSTYDASTDGFVVKPLFFPGGNIGKLAVCGTVNDLAVSGAVPRFISLALVAEEGFSLEKLGTILDSEGIAVVECGLGVARGITYSASPW